jgi:tetratricopeptide (TPR) repeat protein/V8-like Glu-specific endopeptidase/Ran GTPase-activating protein (RanGAP) involved in mRNA processing and transport
MGSFSSRLAVEIIQYIIDQEEIDLECKEPFKPIRETPEGEDFSGGLSDYPTKDFTIGQMDRRARVDDTTKWPYSVQGLLVTNFKDNVCLSSGTIIGPNLVLTSANSVYMKWNGVECDKNMMRFYPGMDGKSTPFGICNVIEVYYPEEYLDNDKEDYALLVLDRNIGYDTGYFGIKHYNRESLKGKSAYLYGYSPNLADQNEHFLWGMKGPFQLDPHDDMIEHIIDTSSGQSGSAIYIEDRRKYHIIGVHNRGGDTTRVANQAVYFNQARIVKIKGWIKDYYKKYNIVREINSSNLENSHEILTTISDSGIDLGNLSVLKLSYNSLNFNQAIRLAQADLRYLSILDLSHNEIGDAGATSLSQANFPHLRDLNLSWNELGDEGAASLSTANFINLTILSLCSNHIGDAGASALSRGQFIYLNILDLSSNDIRDEGAAALSKARFPYLNSLYLTGNKIGNEGAATLSESNFINLHTLNLASNQIADEGATSLFGAHFPNLISLHLTGNKIGNIGATAISQARFTNLNHLYLSHNRIGDEGAAALSQAAFPNLNTLYLSHNQIGDYGTIALSTSRVINLTYLNLSYNQIGDEGVTGLSLANFINLTSLDLEGNLIGNEGAAALLRANWINLRELSLNSNQIGNEVATVLSQVHFPNLRCLDLSYNQIGNRVTTALTKSIFINSRILNLYQNKMSITNLKNLKTEVYGRDSELIRLRNSFNPDQAFISITLYGAKGIGKSTIALKFAIEAIGSYHFIWWIDSRTKDTITSSLLNLADILGLLDSDIQETINLTKLYLKTTGFRFLLIFDNLQDEHLVKEFIIAKGHYIITTQLNRVGFENIEVSSISKEASVELLSTKLSDRKPKELELLGNFLQGHPLALNRSADYIKKSKTKVNDFIQYFSKVMVRNDKLKNIVSDSISSLSEESSHILKIACLGNVDNIPYQTLYKVFCYEYPDANQEDFNKYLGELTRLSILTYDTFKGIFKIFRVIQQAAILQLSHSINDSLIQHYSDYLYIFYNPKSDIYTREGIDLIKNLTLNASIFLTKYKHTNLTTVDILNYSKLAISYSRFFSDETSARKYLQIVEQSLKDQTAIDSDLAQVYINLGDSYKSINEHTRSEECYLRCFAYREPPDIPIPIPIPISRSIPTEIVAKSFEIYGDYHFDMGEYAKSEEKYLESLQIRESILPTDHPDLAKTYERLGRLYLRIGDYTRSEYYYLRCLGVRESNPADNKLNLAIIYSNLADLYLSMGQYATSDDYTLRCLVIMRLAHPGYHPEIAKIYLNLGNIYRFKKEYATSEDCYLRYLEIMQNIVPENDPELAIAYNFLGEVYLSMEDYARSEVYYLRCLKIRAFTLHENHPDLAITYNGLGGLYLSIGDYARSMEYYLRSLTIQKNVLPSNHPDLAHLYNRLGGLYHSMGDYARSEVYYLRCLKILHENHPDLAITYNGLGELYRSMGDYARSGEYYLRSLRIQKNVLPSNHPDLAITYNRLGELYRSMEDYAKSEEYHLKALRIQEDVLPNK